MPSEIEEILMKALERVRTEDSHLFDVDANERTFTHRLAVYLEQQLPGWHVDCEYNRNGMPPKRLQLLRGGRVQMDDDQGCTVFPDIIVHRRGTNDNLLIIEAKKARDAKRDEPGCERDREKLRLYKYELKYKHAAFVIFETKTLGRKYACEFW